MKRASLASLSASREQQMDAAGADAMQIVPPIGRVVVSRVCVQLMQE